jgi:peptidoglycan LD-endopeptidase CwlK
MRKKLSTKEQNKKLALIAELMAKVTLLERLKAMLRPSKLQPLVQRKAQALVESMGLLGLPIRITEGFRSIERQNELYAQGRTTPGQIVTNAKGGQSFHNYGVAVDFVFRNGGYNVPESHWQTLGHVAKLEGFEWGGDWVGFKDRPHVELTLGYKLADFQNGKVDYSKYQ